ncbi:MAG TPA: hypothetical protein VIU11_05640 [Nakamurella sp.]
MDGPASTPLGECRRAGSGGDPHRGPPTRPTGRQGTESREKCFDGPVTFFDCPKVDLWMQGGSDDAGFVQVMEGHTSDADRMRDVMQRYTDEMHRLRPEIIGATVAFGWSEP